MFDPLLAEASQQSIPGVRDDISLHRAVHTAGPLVPELACPCTAPAQYLSIGIGQALWTRGWIGRIGDRPEALLAPLALGKSFAYTGIANRTPVAVNGIDVNFPPYARAVAALSEWASALIASRAYRPIVRPLFH